VLFILNIEGIFEKRKKISPKKPKEVLYIVYIV